MDHDLEDDTDKPNQRWPDLTDLSTELSREARGLRMWFPLHVHGVAVYRDLLESRLDLTYYFADRLKAISDVVEIPVQPDLTVVVARLRGPQIGQTNGWTKSKRKNTFFFSSTEIEGKAVFRLSLGNRRMWKPQVDIILETIRKVLVEMGLA